MTSMLKASKPPPASPPDFRYSLKGFEYSSTAASTPPIPVRSATYPHPISSVHGESRNSHPTSSPASPALDNASLNSSNGRYTDGAPGASSREGAWARSTAVPMSLSPRDRDSQYSQTSTYSRAPTISSSSTNTTTASASIPQIRLGETRPPPRLGREHHPHATGAGGRISTWSNLKQTSSPTTSAAESPDGLAGTDFSGLSLDFSSGFGEELSSGNLAFSKRGSLLLDGKRVNQQNRKVSPALAPIMDDEMKEKEKEQQKEGSQKRMAVPSPPTTGNTTLSPQTASFTVASSQPATRPTSSSTRNRKPAKVLSADEELLSDKVRTFYEAGTDDQLETESTTNLASKMGARWQATLAVEHGNGSIPSLSRATSTTDINDDTSRHPSMTYSQSSHSLPHPREDTELAGGLEDWKDVDAVDVDRYGFILTRAPTDGADDRPQRITRVTTSLQVASETPRRRHTLRRTPSSAHGSTRSGISTHETPPRPSTSQSANLARIAARRPSSSRSILPGSRNKKLLASAMDMLTLPHSASQTFENGHTIVTDQRARRKELAREEKWRRMARPLPPKVDPKTGLPLVGGGSESSKAFTFDTTSPKLVERTWKGIPDTWRATAWHCFLSTSASKVPSSLPDEHLVELFQEYQAQPSPDDVQIDIDVPRTISSHIMFRRRYRGGQRLLFRVLHAMSLHVPETGYVQGMAALAVTLLAYYDEERAFVMLARMWELRGLGKLYKEGFGGLMSALDVFEKEWLGKGEVGTKLEKLGIPATSFGTRWYLTMFNYSIPWGAMLRVWDVYMLLGDDTSVRPAGGTPATTNEDVRFGTTLDVIHATSAALIDGMRDILLESDFENGMKVLTSWIPIQDEDLLMRIARVEWSVHAKRKASAGS